MIFDKLAFSRFGFKIRFYIIIFISVPVLTALTVNFFITKKSILNETANFIKESTLIRKQVITSWINERKGDVRHIAQADAVRNNNPEEAIKHINDLLRIHSDFETIVFIDKNGYTKYYDQGKAAGINVSERAYFKASIEGKSFISDVLISKKNGEPIIAFSEPVISKEGKVTGVVMAIVSLDYISNIVEKSCRDICTETYLVDSKGTFITHPAGIIEYLKNKNTHFDKNDKYSLPPNILTSVQVNESKSIINKNINNIKVLRISEKLHDGRWYLVAEIPISKIMENSYRQASILLICTAVALALSLFFAYRMTYDFTKPIKAMNKMANKIYIGDYTERIDVSQYKSSFIELRNLLDTYNLIMELAQEDIELRDKMMITDPLTMIYNRRFLIQEGQKIVNTCLRSGKPCSALMIDIDFFKKINDTHGHSVGDEVLKHISNIINELIRTSDYFARYGGEEFTIIATNSSIEDSVILCERILEAVRNRPYTTDKIRIPFTVSIGVSEYSEEISYGQSEIEDMLEKADIALYKAKTSGRDRYEIFKKS